MRQPIVSGQIVFTSKSADTSDVLLFKDQLSRAGIEAGPFVGNSFSVTAEQHLMENCFHIRLEQETNGSWKVESPSSQSDSIDVSHITMIPGLTGVNLVFDSPPDFGPTDFFV